jgi:hypothetical protein
MIRTRSTVDNSAAWTRDHYGAVVHSPKLAYEGQVRRTEDDEVSAVLTRSQEAARRLSDDDQEVVAKELG